MTNIELIQTNNDELRECLELANTINDQVDEQADLIAQIKMTANSLPNAGSGGSSEPTGVCPSLTIKANMSQWSLGGTAHLDKVAYYKNNEIQVLTNFLDTYDETGLEYVLNDAPYVIQNVDINRPIMVEGHVQPDTVRLTTLTENVELLFTSMAGWDDIVGIFKITDTNPAIICIGD